MTASRNAQPLPIDADPWLWWQQLRSDLLAGSTIKGHQSPERIAVLAERRGDQWPLELELCEYFVTAESEPVPSPIAATR